MNLRAFLLEEPAKLLAGERNTASPCLGWYLVLRQDQRYWLWVWDTPHLFHPCPSPQHGFGNTLFWWGEMANLYPWVPGVERLSLLQLMKNEVECLALESNILGFKSQLFHTLAVWSWASHFASLSLCFFIR